MTSFRPGVLLHEGKAKLVHATNQDTLVAIVFKDEATAFNGLKHSNLPGKGVINAQISARLFSHLATKGIPTHYVGMAAKNVMLARSLRIVPLEVVVRNIAAGSLCKQLPVKLGTCLSPPIIDLYYKDDSYGDPLLNEARLQWLGVVTSEQKQQILSLAAHINDCLLDLFEQVDLQLVDFKIELGICSDGALAVADEISPDTCRLWDRRVVDARDRILDKDRFRQDLGAVVDSYGEILKRVQGVCPEPVANK